MQAQDKPETKTFYDVYLDVDDVRHFCKRYERKAAACNLCHWLDMRYKHLGYAGQIVTVEIAPAGLRSENGGHSTGAPSQVQDNSPVG
ncbi:hypothetical protein ES703_12505 [subsurface metagenome]